MPDPVPFTDRSAKAIVKKKSVLCVGLDPQLALMPKELIEEHIGNGHTIDTIAQIYEAFNMGVIAAVADLASWAKPQMAFYEVLGSRGIAVVERTIAQAQYAGMLVIVDGKRGDGGDTATAYAQTYLGRVPFFPDPTTTDKKPLTIQSPLQANALTAHGYIGDDCIMRMAKEAKAHGSLVFVVDKTSFKPNSRIEQLTSLRVEPFKQELEQFCIGLIGHDTEEWTERLDRLIRRHTRPVWEEMAGFVKEWGEGTQGEHGYTNVGVVMGATYPRDATRMREILPNAWFLVPGYGKQGGAADDAVLGADENGFGIAVNSSRGILYPPEDTPEDQDIPELPSWAKRVRTAAKNARDELNAALLKAKKGKAFLET